MPDIWHRLTGKVDGDFVPDNPDHYEAVLRLLEGKRVELALHVERRDRTLAQNAYLHVIAHAISEASGHSVEDIKVQAVYEALGEQEALHTYVRPDGRLLDRVRGTSELKTHECSRVMDWLLDKAAFLEITLPERDRIEVM